MNKQEKEDLAREMLKRNGYSDEEIEDILRYAFGDVEAIDDSPD